MVHVCVPVCMLLSVRHALTLSLCSLPFRVGLDGACLLVAACLWRLLGKLLRYVLQL